MRPRLLSFAALAAVVLLAGCGKLSLWPTAAISVGIVGLPLWLTYGVPPIGRPVPDIPPMVTLTSRPGSVAATIRDLRVFFYDASGNPLIEGFSLSFSLNVRVPAGLQCREPGVGGECSINDPGAEPAPGTPVSIRLPPLPLPIILTHIQLGSPPGTRAEILFSGIDDNGREFNLEPVTVPVLRRS
jgi:hypothetical protein